MKHYTVFIALLIMFSAFCKAQEPLTYSKVIQTDSVGKTIIYTALRDWFAVTYNSSKDVIQMDDKDAGLIIGNARTKYYKGLMAYGCYEGWIKYTIKVQVKDNRYKVEFTNIMHENKPGNAPSCELGLITTSDEYTNKGMNKNFHNEVWKDIKAKMENYANEIYTSMEEKTHDLSSYKSGSDW